jgi:CHAT domain-containing protein
MRLEMTHNQTDDNLLRLYLLGALSEGDQRSTEQRLLGDKEFSDLLHVAEDELFDDYLSNNLSEIELKQFESYFLASPLRQRRLIFARSLRKYIINNKLTGKESAWEILKQKFRSTLTIRILVPATAILIFGLLGIGSWQFYQRSNDSKQRGITRSTPGALDHDDVNEGLNSLRSALSESRLSEIRISGFPYSSPPEPPSTERTRGTNEPDDALDSKPEMVKAGNYLKFAADKWPKTATFHALGKYHLARSDFNSAITELKKALDAEPHAKNDAQLNSDLGAAYLGLGIKIRSEQANKSAIKKDDPSSSEQQQSLMYFGESLKYLDRALELDSLLLEALFNRALCHYYMFLPQQSQQAEDDWNLYLKKDPDSPWAREAKKYLEEIQKKKQKAALNHDQMLDNFVRAYKARDGTTAREIAYQSRSRTGHLIAEKLIDNFLDLRIRGQTANANDQLNTLLYLGKLEAQLGDQYISHLAYFYRTIGPQQIMPTISARCLMRTGHQRYKESKYDKALQIFSQAAQLFQRANDTPELLFARLHIGRCYWRLPNLDQSYSTFESLIHRAKIADYKWLLAESLNGMASTQISLNEYSKAIKYNENALNLMEKLKDLQAVTDYLVSLGDRYRYLDQNPKSLFLIENALAHSRLTSPDNQTIRRIYTGIALNFSDLELYTGALHYNSEILRMAQNERNPAVAGRAQAQIGLNYGRLNNHKQAIKHVQDSYQTGKNLAKADSAAGQEMMAYAALHLGELYRQADMLAPAIESYKESIELYNKMNFPFYLYSAHKGKFLAHIKQNDYQEAQKEIIFTLHQFEQYRSKILDEQDRNVYFDAEHGIYDLAIDFEYSKLNDHQKAFEYMEKSRARSLFDLINLPAQYSSRDSGTGANSSSPPLILNIKEIQSRIPDDAQILQYAMLEDKIIIYVISKTSVTSRMKTVEMKSLSDLIKAYLVDISDLKISNTDKIRRSSAMLYDYLIKPVEQQLNKDKLLCIVPDKMLYHLPFAALFSDSTGRYLLEDYILLFSPSSNIFIKCTEIAGKKGESKLERILSIGNPHFNRSEAPTLKDLPEAAREARMVAGYYRYSDVLTGAAAKEITVRSMLMNANIAHFATHAVIDQQLPARSCLMLMPDLKPEMSAQDGRLQAGEILAMNYLSAKLVVLSACQTGVELTYKGEGAVSIARPFIAVKIPLVVASYWPVESVFTEKLMVKFHQYRGGSIGRDTATVSSLRRAQLEMLHGRDNRYRHPYYWASFMVIGGYAKF